MLQILLFDVNFQFVHLLVNASPPTSSDVWFASLTPTLGIYLRLDSKVMDLTIVMEIHQMEGEGEKFQQEAEHWSHSLHSLKNFDELSYNRSHFMINSDGPFPWNYY